MRSITPHRETVARTLYEAGERCVYYCYADSFEDCTQCQNRLLPHADAVLALFRESQPSNGRDDGHP